MLAAYGDIAFRAWNSVHGVLQGLIDDAIHSSSCSFAASISTILVSRSSFFAFDEPVFFPSLQFGEVPNSNVRRNASHLLLDLYPLEDPNSKEAKKLLVKQFFLLDKFSMEVPENEVIFNGGFLVRLLSCVPLFFLLQNQLHITAICRSTREKMAEAVVTKLAEEIAGGCVSQIKHHFQYLSQYHQNMTNLEANIKNLEKKEVSVRDEVSSAISNSQTIKGAVNAWLGKVKVRKEDAEKILEMKTSVGSGCWKGWCVNMRPRYTLSKKAMKKAVDLVTFIEEGVFDTVAHPKRPLAFVFDPMETSPATYEDNIRGDDISENINTQDHATKHEVDASTMAASCVDERLESRTILLNDVMEAVRDPHIRIVQICGMGGIGKTTMAKQVEKMARKERLFHEIAMVEVNQNPDLKLLQRHVAELFGLNITEDNVLARARWLGERLSGQNSGVPNKKILLILDNVWKIEDLEKAGIPLQDAKGCCKILLTSRYDHLCVGCTHGKSFKVNVLSYPEALALFHQSLAGGSYYDEIIAEELVKACGGLPISIATIAGAVRKKTEREWKYALRRLQNSDLREEYAAVFKCLEISYDSLENEKIKKFFRLCCLFRKGSDVSIEKMTRYGSALCLFNDPEYICDAREEAFFYVQTLLHSNLFLRSDHAECLKVHDIVWDFAVSASSSDLFLVNHAGALMKFPRKDSYKNFTSISLRYNKLFQVPESLNFQNLKLLQLTGDEDAYDSSVESLENFFKGMHGLYVLDITRMRVPSPLKSFQQLSHLRSLSLANCYLGDDVSLIGKLGNLEILSFAHSNIRELPSEIKNLKSLRLLDLTECIVLYVIAPRVLSELTSLEELYMRDVPLSDSGGSESVFVDISSMSTLVVLEIRIPQNRVQLMNSLFKKLKKFKIFGTAVERSDNDEVRYVNRLEICSDSSTLLQHGFVSLLKKATRMVLSITHLETLHPLNYSNTLDFSELTNLRFEFCTDLACLVNTMGGLEQNTVAPFRNLKVLDIYECCKLEHVLTLSVAKGLSKLEAITVKDCPALNFIFRKERDDESNIQLPSLKILTLSRLDNLIGCYNIVDAVDFPQLQKVVLYKIPLITSVINCETEASGSGDKDASCNHPFFSHKEPDTVCRFPNLTSLQLDSCDTLRHISTPTMANSVGEVQYLEVYGCNDFQAIVATESRIEEEEDGGTQVLLLPKLNDLSLKNLANLSTIIPNGYALEWSSLKSLNVSAYQVQKSIQTETIIGRQILLTSLEEIEIDGTESLELWCRLLPGCFCCKITDMSVSSHDELSSVFSPSLVRSFDNLETIRIKDVDSEVVFNLEEECSVRGEAEIAALDKLDSILLRELGKMTHVWRKMPKNFEGFHNLTSIDIFDCYSLKYLCSPSIAKCLVKLQHVEIDNCTMIEEVVSTADKEVQKGVVDIVFFPQLQELILLHLPRLTCLSLAVCDIDRLSAEAPNSGTAQMLHHDVSSPSSSSVSTLTWTEKSNNTSLASMRTNGIRRSLSFLHLTEIKVYECHNMSTLFPPNVQVNLPVLQRLSIEVCGNLRYVFSSGATLRSLVEMTICDCKMLEVIVKDDVEEGGGRSKFVFPTLRRIHLEFLPNMEGFCLGKFAFDWPSIAYVTINCCMKMKIFTSGCSTTPLLDDIFIDSVEYSLAEGGGDINTTLKCMIDKNVDNTALRDECVLTRNGFILAGDYLVAQCSSWHWDSIDVDSWLGKHLPDGKKYLIAADVPCLERARPVSESEIEIDDEDTSNNYNDKDIVIHIQRPRKYTIIITYDVISKSTDLWLEGYYQESDTRLPLELVLQDIHESYSQEYVTESYSEFLDRTLTHLNPSENSSSFIKDLSTREGLQPDLKKYFHLWLTALVPTMKCCVD